MNLKTDRSRLQAICEQYNVNRLSVFGSVLTDNFNKQSDLDILVEFDSNFEPSLFTLGGLQQELTELFGITVDLKTPRFFDKSDRKQILKESRVEYERAA